MTMHTAAHAALRAFADYKAARSARRDAWLDRHCDYRAVGEREQVSFAALVTAMDALKIATAADGVRIAAEAGSPQARMFEPSRREARLPGEDGGLF